MWFVESQMTFLGNMSPPLFHVETHTNTAPNRQQAKAAKGKPASKMPVDYERTVWRYIPEDISTMRIINPIILELYF
jgi:hypothetical protein